MGWQWWLEELFLQELLALGQKWAPGERKMKCIWKEE